VSDSSSGVFVVLPGRVVGLVVHVMAPVYAGFTDCGMTIVLAPVYVLSEIVPDTGAGTSVPMTGLTAAPTSN
jgi:hypothetical protein